MPSRIFDAVAERKSHINDCCGQPRSYPFQPSAWRLEVAHRAGATLGGARGSSTNDNLKRGAHRRTTMGPTDLPNGVHDFLKKAPVRHEV
jgi:hypothetical protein